jgi:MFS family permease
MLWGTLFSSAQYAMLAYLALDLHQHNGFALTTGSLFVAVAQGGGLVARIAWGALSDRLHTRGRKPLLFAVNGCAVAGIAALGLLPRSLPTWVLVGVVLVAGLGAMGFQGLFMLVLAEAAGSDRVGAATGFAVIGMQTATVVGVPLYGLVADASGDYRAVWLTLTGVLLAALIPVALLRERGSIFYRDP